MGSASEKHLGEFTTFLGLFELGTRVLDAVGRWQLLADLSTIPFVQVLVNPYAAAVFIFIGSLLLARSREKEFQEAFKVWSNPVLYGVTREPPKKPSAWKMPLTLIGLAAIFSSLTIGVRLLLYAPPAPKAIQAHIETRDELFEIERKTTPKPVAPRIPIQTQICPNGICAGRDINGNPTVNNFAPPERRLSQKQRKDFADALRPSCPFTVAVHSIVGNAEIAKYADQIIDAIHSAGCPTWIPNNILDSGALYGVAVSVPDVSRPSPEAVAVENAFRAAGLSPARIQGYGNPIDYVYVVVGFYKQE